MQMYGIDLASEKFDVSFVNSDGKDRYIQVKNTISYIETFLDKQFGIVKFESKVFICLCARLSLYLKNIGCASA